MERVLKNLKPENVFRIFEDICNIPHPSGHTKAISDYCVNFAKNLGLKYIQDEYGNVIIFKDATAGYENAKTVIVQGHIDMVPDKISSSNHVFETDPLELRIEGNYIKANGTTLGGDDGSGAVYALALLEEDIPHPALEILLTVDEEIGMIGATKADLSMLKGEILINIDSEIEGEFTLGCAGGVKADLSLPVEHDEEFAGEDYSLVISGLKGGHSGIEIDKQRANANNLLAIVLDELSNDFDIRLKYIYGGKMDNAICAKCESIVSTKPSDENKIKNKIYEMEKELKLEYNKSDSGLLISFDKLSEETVSSFEGISSSDDINKLKTTSKETNEKFIKFLKLAPWGVQAFEQADKEKVETSLNLGMLRMNESDIRFCYLVRSSNGAKKKRLAQVLEILIKDLGGSISYSGDYPAWTYNPENEIAPIMTKVYKELTGKEPVVNIVHAGLECGIILSKTKVKSAVSYGPNIPDIHTPNERLDIESTARMYELLKKTISLIK
ncbi:MAG: beta-Ala-His dipeptidase [Parasporobacterium sp.]|nr:beta-Ala-His dipeptidase [Parasporobacterium sp.]